METKKKYFDQLRKKNLRITNARKAMIEVLENNHLTFKEIQRELVKRGFNNVSTVYNNLDFLLEHKIAVELYINDQKYYDLAMDNPMHNADSHIHMILRDTNEITEVNSPEVFKYIKNLDEFKHLNIENIRISISARNK